MVSVSTDIITEIEKGLISLAGQKGNEIAARIRPILYTNLDRKRIQGFIEGDLSKVSDYVQTVANKFVELNPYINKIQSERSTVEWGLLIKQMQTWAYNFLIRKGFSGGDPTLEFASDCATEGAIRVLNAHFPYDTDFEPWAHVLVQNVCRKLMYNANRKSVPQNNIVEIDETLNENLEDPGNQEQEYHDNLRSELIDAVSKLPDERRQVVELIYFRGLSPAEVAEKLGKSIGAIYTIKFNALHDLRKILGKIRDNYNE